MFNIKEVEKLQRWQILQHCNQFEEADKLEKEICIEYNINDIEKECEKLKLIQNFYNRRRDI